MENYEAGVYTEKVLEATKLLSEIVMPCFSEQVEVTIEDMSANVPQPFVENEITRDKRIETWKLWYGSALLWFYKLALVEKPRRTRQRFSFNEEIS